MSIYQNLQEELGENLQENVELKKYSTFKLGGPAKYFFIAQTQEELIKAVKIAKELNLEFFILGGGSNILVNDNGFAGLIIKIEIKELEVNDKIIKASAGALLGQAVNLAMQNDLSGLEWACGIPGTIGGAVRGNAGAYGSDTSKNLISVTAYDVAKDEIKTMETGECEFDYRESIFKKNSNLIVLEAEFKLEAGDKEEIKKIMLEHTKKRICSQPKFPSVGCNFKNIIVTDEIKNKIKKIDPTGLEAIKGGKIGSAWFIDRAGLKGHEIGGAKVSDEHANFIIKFKEDGTAQNVLDLINHIKKTVEEKYNIQLKEEVQMLGFN